MGNKFVHLQVSEQFLLTGPYTKGIKVQVAQVLNPEEHRAPDCKKEESASLVVTHTGNVQ